MFEKARLQLTAWYLLIIMAISLFFSAVIYERVNVEYTHLENMKAVIGQQVGGMPLRQKFILQQVDPNLIQNARLRLIWTLGVINLTILGLAGIAGYFLAGRTLRPIKRMIDEQKRFTADASHELRTPLTALRSEIEVGLRNKTLNTHQAKKLLTSNLEEVIQLQTLSDNLLLLAQTGKINPKAREKISLSECLDAAIKKLNGSIRKKNITINKQVDAVTIVGVKDQICELFVILLDNAVKYSQGKNEITVIVKQERDSAVLKVIDTGVGIHEDDLPHIFDRFYRASKSRSRGSTPGYGLGLSIAKHIVVMHNGTIAATSKVGKGTTFTITLPRVQK